MNANDYVTTSLGAKFHGTEFQISYFLVLLDNWWLKTGNWKPKKFLASFNGFNIIGLKQFHEESINYKVKRGNLTFTKYAGF